MSARIPGCTKEIAGAGRSPLYGTAIHFPDARPHSGEFAPVGAEDPLPECACTVGPPPGPCPPAPPGSGPAAASRCFHDLPGLAAIKPGTAAGIAYGVRFLRNRHTPGNGEERGKPSPPGRGRSDIEVQEPPGGTGSCAHRKRRPPERPPTGNRIRRTPAPGGRAPRIRIRRKSRPSGIASPGNRVNSAIRTASSRPPRPAFPAPGRQQPPGPTARGPTGRPSRSHPNRPPSARPARHRPEPPPVRTQPPDPTAPRAGAARR